MHPEPYIETNALLQLQLVSLEKQLARAKAETARVLAERENQEVPEKAPCSGSKLPSTGTDDNTHEHPAPKKSIAQNVSKPKASTLLGSDVDFSSTTHCDQSVIRKSRWLGMEMSQRHEIAIMGTFVGHSWSTITRASHAQERGKEEAAAVVSGAVANDSRLPFDNEHDGSRETNEM